MCREEETFSDSDLSVSCLGLLLCFVDDQSEVVQLRPHQLVHLTTSTNQMHPRLQSTETTLKSEIIQKHPQTPAWKPGETLKTTRLTWSLTSCSTSCFFSCLSSCRSSRQCHTSEHRDRKRQVWEPLFSQDETGSVYCEQKLIQVQLADCPRQLPGATSCCHRLHFLSGNVYFLCEWWAQSQSESSWLMTSDKENGAGEMNSAQHRSDHRGSQVLVLVRDQITDLDELKLWTNRKFKLINNQ